MIIAQKVYTYLTLSCYLMEPSNLESSLSYLNMKRCIVARYLYPNFYIVDQSYLSIHQANQKPENYVMARSKEHLRPSGSNRLILRKLFRSFCDVINRCCYFDKM